MMKFWLRVCLGHLGTDKNYFLGHMPRGTKLRDLSPGNGDAHFAFPLLMGHEGAGVIAAVDKKLSIYKEGGRVNSFLWRNTMADYSTLPTAVEGYGAVRVPKEMNMDTATLGEPSACAVYAGLRSGVELSDTVAVVDARFP